MLLHGLQLFGAAAAGEIVLRHAAAVWRTKDAGWVDTAGWQLRAWGAKHCTGVCGTAAQRHARGPKSAGAAQCIRQVAAGAIDSLGQACLCRHLGTPAMVLRWVHQH